MRIIDRRSGEILAARLSGPQIQVAQQESMDGTVQRSLRAETTASRRCTRRPINDANRPSAPLAPDLFPFKQGRPGVRGEGKARRSGRQNCGRGNTGKNNTSLLRGRHFLVDGAPSHSQAEDDAGRGTSGAGRQSLCCYWWRAPAGQRPDWLPSWAPGVGRKLDAASLARSGIASSSFRRCSSLANVLLGGFRRLGVSGVQRAAG